jgi:hypothetical protein
VRVVGVFAPCLFADDVGQALWQRSLVTRSFVDSLQAVLDRDDAWWVRIPAQLDLFALIGRQVLASVGIAWDDQDDPCDHLRSHFTIHVSVTTPARCARLLDACRNTAPLPPHNPDTDW